MENRIHRIVALFDIDGTLLDSASIWENIPAEYLKSRGICPREDIRGLFSQLGYSQSARYLCEHYLTADDPHAVMDGFCQLASVKYGTGVSEKPAAFAYLSHLKARGIRCVALTSNLSSVVLPALERLGMMDSIESLSSIYDIGMDKRTPDIFFYMAKQLNVSVSDCVVFEDALFAAENAKKAGMRVVGVYDRCADKHWERMRQVADRTIRSYEELIEHDIFE